MFCNRRFAIEGKIGNPTVFEWKANHTDRGAGGFLLHQQVMDQFFHRKQLAFFSAFASFAVLELDQSCSSLAGEQSHRMEYLDHNNMQSLRKMEKETLRQGTEH